MKHCRWTVNQKYPVDCVISLYLEAIHIEGGWREQMEISIYNWKVGLDDYYKEFTF